MLLLIDYSSMLYRAYHSTPYNVPMNGVHGFLLMLARMLKERRPDRLAIATDEDWRPAFRVAALPMYKTQRGLFALAGCVHPLAAAQSRLTRRLCC
jgi:5'-3' exonuclease